VNRDVGKIVRNWRIRFTGGEEQSIDVFIERLEAQRIAAGLSGEEMLAGLGDVFTGDAQTWYLNNRDEWQEYEQFIQRARSWYGTSLQQQQRLRREAHARYQGPEEPVRSYLTKLQAMAKRISPPMSTEDLLELMYSNLLPEIQSQIRRSEVASIDELCRLGTEAQSAIASARQKRVLLEPKTTLFPEWWCQPSSSGSTSRKPKVAAMEHEEEEQESTSPPASLAAADAQSINLEVMRQLEKTLALWMKEGRRGSPMAPVDQPK